MKWVRRLFPKVEELPKDKFLTPEWPEEVLIVARRGVVKSGYTVAGGEPSILRGDFDHWPVIQAACYALCDHHDISSIMPKLPIKPKLEKKAKTQKVETLEDKLDRISQEVERKLNGLVNDDATR